jgi:hypothetical protein
MTRWSLRRRSGGTQDAEREYRPGPAAPAAGHPSAAQSPAGQPATDQAQSGQPASGQATPGPQAGQWFQPNWSRPGQPGPSQPGASQYGPGDQGAAEHGRGQPGGAGYAAGGPGAGSYGPGQQGASQNGAGQYRPGQYGADKYGWSQAGNGVAVLGPVQPPPPAGSPASVPRPDPVAAAPQGLAQPDQGERASGAWPDICDQFGLHLLVLAEQLRTSLDELEADEGDPERLKRLYQVDHAVTRMRRASRDLRTLAGRSEEELAGLTTSLLDIIRMACSAIERYTQVSIGRVADLAVLGYAADDIGSVMAALLDNATRYSPGTVTVSGHLLEDGGVMFRIEDTGIGMGADQVAALNAAFAGSVPEVDERTGRHTGFPIAHRIARKHSLGIRLAARPLPSSGTVAMVMLPPHLLCEVPEEEAQRRPVPATQAPPQLPPRPSAVSDLPRGEPTRAHPLPQWEPPELPARVTGDLPRRERASLRGDEPRPEPQEPGMVPTAEQQAAARRAFADDLSAFSLGTVGSPDAAGDAGDTATTATEEDAQL